MLKAYSDKVWGDMEIHTNSNAVTYHPCFLALSQIEMSKNFVFNICVPYILDSWFQTFAMFWMLYAFFWVILRRLNFTCPNISQT